ncbi:4441_t:CDS:2 [Dentiscutata erythropus]|uniref:4441_t:CDS:1 n=1 Tax=Dentiscutata erythropus TaxID=1348616 RepID=A0A9N9D7Q5_9GLOM|nr:4441_t:CDS:2 [Dentiscutata erythropus]
MGIECNVRPHCLACKKKLCTIGFCTKEECRRVQILEKESKRVEKENEPLQILLEEKSKIILTLEQRIQRITFGEVIPGIYFIILLQHEKNPKNAEKC